MNADCRDEPDAVHGADLNADDQLAELQLLSRVDHDGELIGDPRHPPLVRGGTTLMLDIVEDPAENAEDDEEELPIEVSGSSSFTALLAASRRLAGKSASAPAATEVTYDGGCLDSPLYGQDSRTRRPTTLPALTEEDTELPTPESRTPVTSEATRAEAVDPSEEPSIGEEERISIPVTADPAFEDMLEQLVSDPSLLTLSVTDFSVQNLSRVRDAIAQSKSTSSRQQIEVGEAKTPLSQMRLVRTLLALDTLRLFMLRHDEANVLLAVTDAIRQIYEQYVHVHGVGPLSHSHGVVTASNITRVVLLVRDMLQRREAPPATPLNTVIDNNTAERASPSRLRRGKSSPMKLSNASPLSWHARHSLLCLSPFSPSKRSLSPRSRTPTSPRSPGSTTSSASLRRSILASDGAHVLMNEKLAMYQHRGDVNQLPSFKVRRDSEAVIEEATKRRERSMLYAQETVQTLRA